MSPGPVKNPSGLVLNNPVLRTFAYKYASTALRTLKVRDLLLLVAFRLRAMRASRASTAY